MKNRGLQNRFPSELKYEWQFWYDCLRCGQNRWDALHHIVSPSMLDIYRKPGYGQPNYHKSILNSCPIHNHKCHIGHETWLHQNAGLLLGRTRKALEKLGYQLNDLDRLFLSVYSEFYDD